MCARTRKRKKGRGGRCRHGRILCCYCIGVSCYGWMRNRAVCVCTSGWRIGHTGGVCVCVCEDIEEGRKRGRKEEGERDVRASLHVLLERQTGGEAPQVMPPAVPMSQDKCMYCSLGMHIGRVTSTSYVSIHPPIMLNRQPASVGGPPTSAHREHVVLLCVHDVDVLHVVLHLKRIRVLGHSRRLCNMANV